MNETRLLFIVVFVFFLTSISLAEDKRTIKMGYIEFFPETYTTESGQPAGYFYEMMIKTAQKAGYNLTAKSYPTKRLIRMLIDGELDIWPGLSTLAPLKETTLVGTSIIGELQLRAYTVGKKEPILKKEDLIGKNIVILRGYSYGGWASYIKESLNEKNVKTVNSHVQALKMLRANRVQYVLDYKHPVDDILKLVSVPDLQSNEISSLSCYFVVSKTIPDAEKVLSDFEKAYQDIFKN